MAKFLLRSGVSFTEFAEISRVAFVRVASQEYGIRGRPTNISRVAAMTGIGRKDVTKLRRLVQEYDDDLRIKLSPLSDVLHHWHIGPDFRDKAGAPKPLPFRDGKNSFERLVRSCVGDVPAGAIRAELIRCGAVVENEKGLLQVIRREVIPETFDEKLITSLAFNLRGLAATIAFNSNPDRLGSGRIERFVQSDDLDEDAKEELRVRVREKISAFAEEIDDLFSEYETIEVASKNRAGIGIYYYEDDAD